MSGRRTKALRREFCRIHGRPPETEETRFVTRAARPAITRMIGDVVTVVREAISQRTAIAGGSVNEFRRFRRATWGS